MSLKQAIPFLRGVLSSKSSTGAPQQFVFHEGMCYAQSPAFLAAYPTPHILGTFGLAADELESALGRMKDEPRVSAGDETLILSSGRLRSSIRVFEAVEPSHEVDLEDPDWQPVPDGFLPALRKASLFMSTRGTWQTSVKLGPGKMTALNDRSAIEVTVPGLDLPGEVALPDSGVRQLEQLEAPDRFQLLEGAMLFAWSSSGAWARCQLSVFPWQEGIFEKVLTLATNPGVMLELDADWKDAFGDAIALSDTFALVDPSGVKAPAEHATHELPFETGAKEATKWSLPVLKQLLAVADRWSPDSNGPAKFEGPDCVGVVMRQR